MTNATGSEAAAPSRGTPVPGGGQPWLAPALLAGGLLLILALIAVLVVAGREDEPPRPGLFAAPAPARPVAVADVQEARAGALVVATAGGNEAVTLRSDVQVIRLAPARAGDAAPGDWVTVVGIPNEVLNYTIRRVVIIPSALLPTPDDEGLPRIPAGFAGHEAQVDQKERPLLSGRVEQVQGTTITLVTRTGQFTLDTGTTSLLSRMVAGDTAAIRAGDRVAWLPAGGSGRLADAPALLVLPQTNE